MMHYAGLDIRPPFAIALPPAAFTKNQMVLEAGNRNTIGQT